MRDIVSPVLDGLRSEGHDYTGFLYVGLMLTAQGPKVVEFNVRFGDPEAQVILPRIEGDLVELLAACAGGRLDRAAVAFSPRRLVGVVLASKGYPASSQNDVPIHGVEAAESSEDLLVFHAGTAERDGRLVTHGGRVLTVVGRGDNYEQAIGNAYQGVSRISFDGMQYRRDIGRKALRQPEVAE
jgi:phosphoribosylamine--glycine ligase